MNTKSFKIIIADGDFSYSTLVGNSLSERGFENIKLITDFSSFSDDVLSYKPDIILMDVVLPCVDGLAFIKGLKDLFGDEKTPEVIVASAFYNERYIKESSAHGVFGYFIKPVFHSVIADAIENACENKRGALSGVTYGSFGKSSISIVEEPVSAPSFSVDFGNTQRKLIVKVTQLLHDMGIPAHLCGHDYLRDAILMVMESNEVSGRMTKEIYPEIANKYKKSPQSVERAIRTALDVAWTRGKTELINDIFRFTVNIQKGRPTNSEFVSLIADYLNYEVMSPYGAI